MLSGRAPFQAQSQEDTAENIMQRIKEGEFNLSGPEWASVSEPAKKLIKGAYSVNYSHRFICYYCYYYYSASISEPAKKLIKGVYSVNDTISIIMIIFIIIIIILISSSSF